MKKFENWWYRENKSGFFGAESREEEKAEGICRCECDKCGMFYWHCAFPENIHTPPTEGIGISGGGGVFWKTKTFNKMHETWPGCIA